jgi:hypothetical protein
MPQVKNPSAPAPQAAIIIAQAIHLLQRVRRRAVELKRKANQGLHFLKRWLIEACSQPRVAGAPTNGSLLREARACI